MKWIEYKKGWEISAKPMHFNMTWKEQNELLNKGEKIADYPLLQKLRNSGKYPNSFKYFWVNVPNPDNISKRKYVAGFGADSDWAVLGCNGDPSYADATLGVFVVRKKLRRRNDVSKE